MKRHLSIWMLMARSTICKVLGLLLALAAADGVLFALTLRQDTSILGLEQVLAESHLSIVLAMCRVYAAQDPDMVNSQTVFLAFYRVPFLHSLLPLADGWRYVRNAVLCAALGVCAAAFPVQQRQGNRGFAAVILTALTVLFFVQPVRSGDFWLIGALVVITAVALLNVTEVFHETA